MTLNVADDPHMTISACIPTYKRPQLLKDAILSCLAQTRRPDVIYIGDDSPDDDTEAVVSAMDFPADVQLDYTHNKPGLGQNENINFLFRKTTTTHLVLLHDDDLLEPTALEDLAQCWVTDKGLTAAFGKQYIISADGLILPRDTEQVSLAYYRTSDRAGLQPDWLPGIAGFPNDGYMILTSAAQRTLWRPQREVGDAGDYDFGFRLCHTHSGFYFIDKPTAKYRLSNSNSITSSPSTDTALATYRILAGAKVCPEAQTYRTRRMLAAAPVAILQATRLGLVTEAEKIYWGEYHPWARRLSPGGVRRLLAILWKRVTHKLAKHHDADAIRQ